MYAAPVLLVLAAPFIAGQHTGANRVGSTPVKFGATGASSYASGGHFQTHGEQQITVGDNPGGIEDVHITPISSVGGKGKAAELHVHLHDAHFNGCPDKATAHKWASALMEPLGNMLYDAMEGAT